MATNSTNHNKIIHLLQEEIKNDEFVALKRQLHGNKNIGAATLEGATSTNKLLELMEDRGLLGPDDYDKLFELLVIIGAQRVIDTVDQKLNELASDSAIDPIASSSATGADVLTISDSAATLPLSGLNAEQAEKIQEAHRTLFNVLQEEIYPEDLDSIKTQVTGVIRGGRLSKMKETRDVLDALEKADKIKPGVYDYLKRLFVSIERPVYKKFLEETENEIQQIKDRSKATKRASNGKNSPEVPKKKSAPQVELTAGDPLTPHELQKYECPKNKGLLLIINQARGRLGSIQDEERIKQFFVPKFYEVMMTVIKRNVDSNKEMEKVLEDAKKKIKQNQLKYLYCFIMGHGNKVGILTKEEIFKYEDLTKCFSSKEELQSLLGQPKVFFIQACRGDKIQADDEPGQQLADLQADEPIMLNPPKDADILVAWATTEEYKALRSPCHGSWFIQSLMEILQDHPCEQMTDILTHVNSEVAYQKGIDKDSNVCRQMSVFTSTLRKKLYLPE